MSPRTKTPYPIVTILIIFFSQSVSPWTFGVSPDIHTKDACLGPAPTEVINRDSLLISDMRSAGAEFLLVSGDLFSGNWLLSDTARTAYGRLPDGSFSLPYFIDNCAHVTYGDFLARFSSPTNGLPVIGVIGDHELGDNNWAAGTEKARAVPFFKRGFAEAFTRNSDGTSKYPGFIGSVPQRPLGTAYEDTSYAFIKHNILFVVVDIFRFEGANLVLDPTRGAVSIDISGDHLAWFDAVLAAGRSQSGVQFIVVAAHCPAILPINLVTTSAVLATGREDSKFWQTIRKHRVELYLAGEVHAMTSSLDSTGDTLQLISGYQNYSHSHLLFDVSEGQIDIRLREYQDDSRRNYVTTGRMVITKSGGKTQFSGFDRLTPIDRDGLLIGYNLNNSNFSDKIANDGQFSKYYYGLATKVSSSPGILGNSGSFSGLQPSYILMPSVPSASVPRLLNPIVEDTPRTVACWVNTTEQAKGTLIALSKGWGAFTLQLTDGIPSVVANGATVKGAASAPLINDGRWHHVAASYPGYGAKAERVRLYVDGTEIPSSVDRPGTVINTWPGYGITIGADIATQPPRSGYTGWLDDCGAWASALSDGMIAAINNSARDPAVKLDAATIDKVFSVFRTNTPSNILGKTWYRTDALPGIPGTITKYPSGDYTLVLTDDGKGVTTLPPSPPTRTNLLANPAFEAGLSGWKGTPVGKSTTDAHSGASGVLFSTVAGFKGGFYQKLSGLSAGIYDASIWHKQVGSVSYSHLGVKVINAEGSVLRNVTKRLSGAGNWNETVISDIAVKAGEGILFNVWMEVGPGGGVYLDDAAFSLQ